MNILTEDRPATLPGWKLEDAKAHFSELVRRAQEGGPQRVTRHGRDAVVVVSAAEFARLSPAGRAGSLAALFGEGPFARLDTFDVALVREPGAVRPPPDFMAPEQES